MTQCDTT